MDLPKDFSKKREPPVLVVTQLKIKNQIMAYRLTFGNRDPLKLEKIL